MNKVHFLHIGKTGGSALKSALQNSLTTRHYSILLHRHNVKLTDIPVGEKVTFFLRDPITRFISGFYSRQRKGRPRHYVEWKKAEKEIFTAFNTPNELAVALSQRTSPDHALAIKAMNEIRHLNSYFDWFNNIEYFNSRIPDILFIGFQETLDDDFAELKEILGLPDYTVLPRDDFGAHRNPAHLDKTLDGSAANVLRNWYARDIEFVDICKQMKSMLNIRGNR